MTNDLGYTKPTMLLRDSSCMDYLVAERLRATITLSVEWAEQTLDSLVQLDDDLKKFMESQEQAASVKQRSLSTDGSSVNACQEATHARVHEIRNRVRDVIMAMQHQDVISQSMERVSRALEKRAGFVEKVVESFSCHSTSPTEIAEIHRAYQEEDDLHRLIGRPS